MNGARKYSIWAMAETKNPTTGSKVKTYSYVTNLYAVVQETGTKGLSLQPTKNQGDTKNADAIMYSKKRRKLKERVLFNNLYYEIRKIKDFDNGLLKYYKSSLVKVDNQ